MKTFYAASISLLAVALMASACAPAATPVPTAVPTMAPADTSVPATPASSSGSSTVTVALSTAPGAFLVDGNGMTLYLYTKDTPNSSVSTCYDTCAGYWPPLTVTGAPVAGNGVDASKLATIQRTDGSMQVTYNGWPLYYFAKDVKPGDATGQGAQSVWYEVSASGDQITK